MSRLPTKRSMSFDRRRVQETYEIEFGYTADQLISDEKNIKNHRLSSLNVANLQLAANLDLIDYYFKALISLYEAIYALEKRNFSWATVKLYYCIFYLLQTELLLRGILIIRGRFLHKLTLQVGESPEGKKDRSDHKGTISIYMDSFRSSDPLLSNQIGGEDSYVWFMHQRERINYRERYFNEPNHPDFWSGPVSNGIASGNAESVIEMYLNDDAMSFTFQEDHAIIALPLRKFLEVVRLLKNYGNPDILSTDQKNHLRNILKFRILDEFIEI